MGIVNVTPDSFSDGGRFDSAAAAVTFAQTLIDEGADIVDVGGESTRPGSIQPSLDEELRRVIPVVRGLRDADVPVSVDTGRPEVIHAALAEGATVINDVRAFQTPGAIDAVRASECGLVVMHMQGTPETMQQAPQYDDVVAEVRRFLSDRCLALHAAGVAPERIVVDPGFGFGKKRAHNLALLSRLADIADGAPILVGLSRKSVLGQLTGRGIEQRLVGSIAAAVLAVERGARIVRVHDVAATRDALHVVEALHEVEAALAPT